MTILPIAHTSDGRTLGIDLALANRHGLVTGSTGTGKCWGRGTPIIRFDGQTVPVETIKAGDLLMGPDSTPRRVLSTTHGYGPLYRVVPVKGEPWVCNDVHILSLRCTANVNRQFAKGQVVNVPLNEWLEWTPTRKHLFKLWRTGVDFPAAPCLADPYLAGLYLADGTYPNATFSHNPKDVELLEFVASKFEHVSRYDRKGCAQLRISRDDPFWCVMKPVMEDDRRPPDWLMVNSREVRLAFLAGLVDGDGHVDRGSIDFVSKHEALARGVAFVAQSLGFAAYVKQCRKTIKSVGFEGRYFRVSISGATHEVPTRLDRKRSPVRAQKKDVLNTGFSVEPIGDGEYFGFELDGDRLCLLGDFTVTHNTVTLQRMAEQFSAAGVPVFAADIKGDLSGLAALGSPDSKLAKRAADLGVSWTPDRFPVRFWDLYGEEGIKLGTSVDEMGVPMMARVLDLNDTQAGVLNVLSHAVHDGFFPGGAGGLRSLDCIHAAADQAYDYTMELRSRYGHVSPATLGMVQRQCLALHAQNGWRLFREPAFQIADLMEVRDGRGVINLMVADRLMEVPRLYSTFLLYLLTELFRTLPEVGDLDKPKIVFFFDEAHLLFANAPKSLLETIERLVRLIRSKGVGVYFVTQSPRDVPDTVLAQLGNRIQHALRAFTPKDQRMVRAAATSFRPNKGVNVCEAITSMAVGECLFSPLVEGGVPAPVERCMVLPPTAQVGPISSLERQDLIRNDLLRAKYGDDLDDDAAYDAFEARVHPKAHAARQEARARLAQEQAEVERVEALRLDYEANKPGKLGVLAMMVGLREVHPYLKHLAQQEDSHGRE